LTIRIAMAETDAEREAVYRLRYDVYVEEMGRYQSSADHQRRMLYEDVDRQSRISLWTTDYADLPSDIEDKIWW
jgi:hypothetical protein